MRLAALVAVGLAAGTCAASWSVDPPPVVEQEELRLPAPLPRAFDRFIVEDALSVRSDDERIIAEGRAWVTYRGYEVYAERIEFDRATEVVRAENGARLVGFDGQIDADVIVADMQSGTYTFERGDLEIRPDLLGPQVQDSIYLDGEFGSATERLWQLRGGGFTTCEFGDPHFELRAQAIDVIPDRRVDLRNVDLIILDRKILRIPHLSIPLVDRGERYLPEFGQSPDEGYFVKARWTTPLSGDDIVDWQTDYFTKLGFGVGGEYSYERDNLDGSVRLYGLSGGPGTVRGGFDHRQRIGDASLSLAGSYQNRDYLTAPESTISSARAVVSLPSDQGNSTLSLNRIENASSGFSSRNFSAQLSDTRRWSDSLRTDLRLSLAQNRWNSSFGGGSRSERLDVRFNANQEFRSFAAELLYQRSVPIEQDDGFFATNDRTPVLSVSTDGRRLLGEEVGRVWPIRAEMSIGELADPGRRAPITRIGFDASLRRSERLGPVSLNWNTRFRQGLYSDDTAQFSVDAGGRLDYRLDGRTSLGINYLYARQQGFTPLAVDRLGRRDAFSFEARSRPTDALTLSVQSGYDLRLAERGQVPWQQVWFRGGYSPSNDLDVSFSSVYDTFQQVWGLARVEAQARAFDADWRLGVNYDARRSIWSHLNLGVRGFTAGRFRVDALLDYNGFTQKLESQQYTLTYDMHCSELILEVLETQAGFRAGRQIGLYFRLKALPFSAPFGVGNQGQPLGGGSGFGF